ncbi:MAG TPA: DUF1343 domain-containing protein [Vicinamibacterales bacterium]|nr:DUF1343 domain-containing protein [Vicinamibacterales bacterium]
MAVTLGSTRLLASGRLRGLRVGVVANPASVDHDFVHIVDRVRAADGVALGAIFGPQHGFRSDLQDNMIESPHGHDDTRRVPVYSLYSETREPTAAMLTGLDALVVDLQDIGARIYTFVYTMANCLIAGRTHGVPVIVCDRPNPINGIDVEGASLVPGFESFVGQFPIPMRHGMTIGELAQLFNRHFAIGADLEVIAMEGWQRAHLCDEAGVPWIMPSPNMPTLDTAIVYPGTVLLEGTMASEGRGTTRPFEVVGAPWVQAEAFADRLNGHQLPGVTFRPAVFEPTFQKHHGVTCGGCQIHVTDRHVFPSVATGVAVIEELRRANPASFAWRPPPYEYEHRLMPIDILSGSSVLREQIEAGASAGAIAQSWHADEDAFRATRAPFLIYG